MTQIPASLADIEVVAFFLVGLLGGAHCIGMCGPLVTLYSDRMNEGRKREALTFRDVRQHTLFNIGRTISYALIGAVMGLLGMVLFSAASYSWFGNGVRGIVGVLVGGFVLASGGRYVLQGSVVDLPGTKGFFRRIYRGIQSSVDRLVNGVGVMGLGAIHAFLPCPLLYPAFVYAFARGNPFSGALWLAALGVGTIPSLFLYATILESVSRRRRSQVHRLLGIAFLVLGLVPLTHGLTLLGFDVPHIEIPTPVT